MSFVKRALISPLGAILGLGKKQAQAAALPVAAGLPSRNAAIEAARGRDTLAKRRGTIANMVIGSRGAEASGVGAKSKLGI